jgi:hypothetical protein
MKHTYSDSVLADAKRILGEKSFQAIFKSASDLALDEAACGDKTTLVAPSAPDAEQHAADDDMEVEDDAAASDGGFDSLLADDFDVEAEPWSHREHSPESVEDLEKHEDEVGELFEGEGGWTEGHGKAEITDFHTLASVVAHLVKASELLDHCGFSKQAASVLDTALIVEAKKEEKKKELKKGKGKKEEKKDDKKKPVKKEEKKDEKKSDKKPFGGKAPAKKDDKKPVKKDEKKPSKK